MLFCLLYQLFIHIISLLLSSESSDAPSLKMKSFKWLTEPVEFKIAKQHMKLGMETVKPFHRL